MTQSPRACSAPPARPLLIVAGPTASGKSALALAAAQRFGGTIINADAMQCYADWRIITARPTPADEAAAPHRLYGVRRLEEAVDAAWWRGRALAELAAAELPILCGGTGMYLSSLVNGIAPIPDPGPDARAEARRMLAADGPAALHAWLAARDPATATKLRPSDPQRLARAAEVLLGTGRGLAAWHAAPRAGLAGYRVMLLLLDPPRPALREAIAARFEAMLAAGALAEVAAVAARAPDPALPGLRAHGVPELLAHLAGAISLDEATSRAIAATAAYTKRQATWFRHQKLADQRNTHTIRSRFTDSTQFSESTVRSIISFINLSS
ncbi:tRNA (adenosine(37)-N6)-dimethylallyltransferase MiaA [Acidiphilium sp.]|uniref:tRNA (adenosine(37)-N6)-dimethylallyltransferase MiaA n=1 Tax=Acidiphilium sp. TaxID=527 RepID=UPI002589E28C|nr:tRNA (adenosine(37)-N6)-dimethylallyltransferase MiaA [Acidiphilium sp.]